MADASVNVVSSRSGLPLSWKDAAIGVVLLLLPVLVASCDTPRAYSVNPVGTSYFPIRLITAHPTDPSVYFAIILYLSCIAIIGDALFLRPLMGRLLQGTQPARLLAGFVPGYILSAAFNRLITILFPHRSAPAVTGFSMLLVTAPILVTSWRTRRGSWRNLPRSSRFVTLAAWLASLLLLWMVAVFFLQRQVDHITGDAFVFFDNIMRSPTTGIGGEGHLAIISQHYDELSVLYPLLYGLMGRLGGEPLVCFWILYSFFATGSICLVFISARLMGMGTFESLMILLVLFFGTYSLYPGNNPYVLFDSGNPLSQCLHPGRILGALMPVAGLAMFENRRLLSVPQSVTTLLRCALFGFGIATTTVSNVIVLGFLTLFWIVALVLRHQGAGPCRGFLNGQRELLLVRLIYPFPFVCCISPEAKRYVSPYFLLSIIGALCAFLLLMLAETVKHEGRTIRSLIAGVCSSKVLIGGLAGLSASLLLFGNILIGKTAALLGEEDRIWNIPILTRRLYSHASVGLLQMVGPYESSGQFPLEHTYCPGDFIAHFGLVFMILTATLYLWSKIRKNRNHFDRDDSAHSLMLFLTLFMLAFLIGLFGYDYMAAGIKPKDVLAVWLRSRLLEPWFYTIIFTFLVLQRRLFGGRGGLAFFTLFTFYLTKDMLLYPGVAVAQWLINARFFFEKII